MKTLLITDNYIHDMKRTNMYGKVDHLLKNAEASKGEIHIISSEHDGGKKLDGLGGISAILRYRMNYRLKKFSIFD